MLDMSMKYTREEFMRDLFKNHIAQINGLKSEEKAQLKAQTYVVWKMLEKAQDSRYVAQSVAAKKQYEQSYPKDPIFSLNFAPNEENIYVEMEVAALDAFKDLNDTELMRFQTMAPFLQEMLLQKYKNEVANRLMEMIEVTLSRYIDEIGPSNSNLQSVTNAIAEVSNKEALERTLRERKASEIENNQRLYCIQLELQKRDRIEEQNAAAARKEQEEQEARALSEKKAYCRMPAYS
jgi:hypothetical protein